MIRALLRNAGINPARLLAAWLGWNKYRGDRARFLAMEGARDMIWARELPMLTEYKDSAGCIGPYFLQDAEAARWILADAPKRHVDVGSRVDGFIGHLTVFREVEVIDIREPSKEFPGARFHRLDITRPLPERWVGSADSVSCLHSIEHFGLGRYGDPINPRGHLAGLAQLQRMVAPGGRLLISVPLGRERLEFNAHRVFALPTILGWFEDGWAVQRFAFVDDEVNLHSLSDWRSPEAERSFGCQTGVAILQAKKLSV